MNERIKKFCKNYDKLLMIGIYAILIINTIFLLFQIQNVFVEYVSAMNVFYLVVNVFILILSLVIIYYINNEDTNREFLISCFLIVIWLFYYCMVLWVTVYVDVDGGMLYRNNWAWLFFWIIGVRTLYLGLCNYVK